LLPKGAEEDMDRDIKITAIKLPPKKEEPKLNVPHPTTTKVDQVCKPVVAKAEVTEEPPKIVEIKEKKLVLKRLKEIQMQFVRSSSRSTQLLLKKTIRFTTAGIEVKPEFPGGMAKFYKYVGDNYRAPEEEGLRGKVYVTFVWKRDGSLTDIKVLRDGYGTGKEVKSVNRSPRWNPGIQNGKPVRVLYSLPIQIQTAD
jgi:protein TonB